MWLLIRWTDRWEIFYSTRFQLITMGRAPLCRVAANKKLMLCAVKRLQDGERTGKEEVAFRKQTSKPG